MQFKNITSKTGNQSEGPRKRNPNIKMGSIFVGVTLALVAIAIIGYGVMQCNTFYSRIQANWNEISFAYQKPNLVKAMRMQYESRQQTLEDEFTRREKTSQDKLIDEVVGKLQGDEPTATPTSVTTYGKKY